MCIKTTDTRGRTVLMKCRKGTALWRGVKRRQREDRIMNPYRSLEYRAWVLHMRAIGHTKASTPHEYLRGSR